MEIVIVGSGGREYAIGAALQAECRIDGIYFYPGNGASEKLGKNINFKSDLEFVKWAKEQKIGLVIIGPEAPLCDGLADKLRAQNIPAFGPSQKAAQLEASKAFMKNFAKKYNIPTAKYIESSDEVELCEFVDFLVLKNTKIVVKADGLCAGKGVIIAQNADEAKIAIKDMLSGESFGAAGKRVVVEEFLDGFELSVFALCDGESFELLPAAQDHKRLKTGDEGPNTGGMGAYAPAPAASSELLEKIKTKIIAPTLDGMKKENAEFCGCLFCGIMVVQNEPILLEFNVRFGDPECEVLMPLISAGLLDTLLSCADRERFGSVKKAPLCIKSGFCAGVVMASENYPYKSSQEQEIFVNSDSIESSLIEFKSADSIKSDIYYAGVKRENGKLLASGGRVLVCIGLAQSLQKAVSVAYECVKRVSFKGAQYRTDIAHRAL